MTPALVATALVSASWMLLFHGIYGRMYSLFLLTSALSYLACLAAVTDGGRRRWALWVLAILVTVATHPYGALVLASQVVYVLARARTRAAFVSIGAVAVLGVAFLVQRPRPRRALRRRRRQRVERSSTGPGAVLEYLFRVAGRLHGRIHPSRSSACSSVAVVGARALWLGNRDARS